MAFLGIRLIGFGGQLRIWMPLVPGAGEPIQRKRRRAKPATAPNTQMIDTVTKVAGSGVADTVKLSTRSVPAVPTVPPLGVVVNWSINRK